MAAGAVALALGAAVLHAVWNVLLARAQRHRRRRTSSTPAATRPTAVGLRRPGDPALVAFALACGACIAGYTIVDAHGLDHAVTLPYLWLVMALTAAAYLPAVARRHGSATLVAALRPATVAAGAQFFGAYLLVLKARRLAPPGPVAAVRERAS